ncbi:MAG: UDP-3-O-acylglucosamine N-acyltransferase [bacterium]|nr:UDP-3-O-acylglucosamine N-acyltransferase [bacterium]
MRGNSARSAPTLLEEGSRWIAEGVEIGEDCEIGRFVVIEANVRIGDRVVIGDGGFIGEGSRIGDDSEIGARVTLREHTWIGKRVRVEAGVVLGSDGFGFAQRADGTQFKIPQVGIVEVGDDCTIGARATIDRATLGKTVLGERVEIGPGVMVGHNVVIGSDSRLDSLSGVSGSTKIGKQVRIGHHAGLVGHLKVEDGCTIEACTGVTKSLPAGAHLKGVYPAMAPALFEQQQELIGRLPAMVEKLESIERHIASPV